MLNQKKKLATKHPWNLGYYEKIKSANNRNTGKRRNTDKSHKKCLKQNDRRDFPQPKEGHAY